MKCPKCAAVCADTDHSCYACNTSLSGGGGGGERNPMAGRLVTAFVVLGACIGPVVGESIGYVKKRTPRGQINWQQVNAAGIGGAVGGLLGGLAGMLLPKRGRIEQ